MDLTSVSDEDLAKMRDQAAAAPAPAAGPDLSAMSDQDLAALRDHVASQPPPEDPHDLVPFLKNTAKGAVEQVKHAVQHPIDTANDVGDWLLGGGGPGAAGGKNEATLGPITAGPEIAIPYYAVQAYHRSREAGNTFEDALKDARNVSLLIGGGAAVSKGLEMGGDALAESGAGDAVKGIAEEKAFKAAVGNQAKAYNEAADAGVINARGRNLLDEGVVGFGDSAQQIADKAKVAQKATGGQIGDLLGGIDEADRASTNQFLASGEGGGPSGMVDGAAIAQRLREGAQKIGGKGNESLVNRLNEVADHYEGMGSFPLEVAHQEKGSWVYRSGDALSESQKARNLVKSAIGDEMEAAVSRFSKAPAQAPAAAVGAEAEQALAATGTDGAAVAAPPPGSPVAQAVDQVGQHLAPEERAALTQTLGQELGGAEADAPAMPGSSLDRSQQLEVYQDLKSKYGTMKAAAKDAQVNANRGAKNNAFSLGDKAAAAAGMLLNPGHAAAKVATGAVTGGFNKLVRARGNAALAVGLDNIGDLLKSNPEAFGGYAAPLMKAAAESPQKLGVMHYLLMQQDPDYQKLIGGKGEKP